MTGFKNRERASTPSKVHCQNNTFHKFEVGTLPLNGLINEKLNGVGKPQSETKKTEIEEQVRRMKSSLFLLTKLSDDSM